jgi:hypothetical protein
MALADDDHALYSTWPMCVEQPLESLDPSSDDRTSLMKRAIVPSGVAYRRTDTKMHSRPGAEEHWRL